MEPRIKYIKKIKLAIRIILTRFTPCIKNTVFFESFHGQYNDNPKYISERLHYLDPSINIIWAISKHGHNYPPEYVKAIEIGTREYYHYLLSSNATVDNYTGLRTFGFKNKKNRLLAYFVKKPDQLSISTWHGTPLKKIGSDLYNQKKYYCTGTTVAIAGCEYTKSILEKTYSLENRVSLYGTPRNDIFFHNPDIKTLRKKLNLPEKRRVLFAPTFRDSIDMSGINQMKMLDTNILLNKLQEKFGGEFSFIFRVHHLVQEKVQQSGNTIYQEGKIIDGNMNDDMAEYLACTDVLITDYSGSMFDFALTGKPCFLFAPDKQNYINVERGMYMPYETLPFPVAETFEQLITNISQFSKQDYAKQIKDFLDRIGNVEDGLSSDRIARLIIHHIKNDLK